MQEAPRTNRERSSWAVISILVAVLLFGLFWFWQMQQMSVGTSVNPEIPPVSNNTRAETIDYSTLEASAVNITIPSFEELL